MNEITVHESAAEFRQSLQEKAALGMGGLKGAERTERETINWQPAFGSPDKIINPVKQMADARGRDLQFNEGLAHAAVQTHRDSIVGNQFRLNLAPRFPLLQKYNKAFDETWADEFAQVMETIFELAGESQMCWLDYTNTMTFTEECRLAVGTFVPSGEILASAEWLPDDKLRPYATCTQLLSPQRLSNPYGQADTRNLRRGVQLDDRGRPVAYWIRNAYPNETWAGLQDQSWTSIPAAKPWGRPQMLHLYEPMDIGQSRGVADMVSALGDMRMASKFRKITLQNAIIQASYAAAIETELPPEAVYQIFNTGGTGEAGEGFAAALGAMMGIVSQYLGGGKNMNIDGASVPVLPPGTKLNAKPLGTPGGVGTDFEKSLHRHAAAALGISTEEYTQDFTGLSYSTVRASGERMRRSMKARKKITADGYGDFKLRLLMEEAMQKGDLPLPVGIRRNDIFYQPLAMEAFTFCNWIGSGSGQIDELKETQAAILRIAAGLSTWENEIARLGGDWRTVFLQRRRENALAGQYDLTFNLTSTRPGGTPDVVGAGTGDESGQQEGQQDQ